MGVTKTSDFTEAQNQTTALLKALAHPARVAILEHLLREQRCICGDIVSELPLAQATVSQHLKEMKQAGMILGTVEGTSVCYCLNTSALEFLHGYFGRALDTLKAQGANCCH